jgi:hypothetical protein
MDKTRVYWLSSRYIPGDVSLAHKKGKLVVPHGRKPESGQE